MTDVSQQVAAEPLRVGTHSGSFHADEVFALAALRLKHGAIGIIRTRDADALAQCDLRVDVGRKYDPSTGDFDHHQGDAGERENGIRYASFGLIWKEVGEELCGSAVAAAEVDGTLVAPIDAGDNGQELGEPIFEGVAPYTLSRIVARLGPEWDSDDPERDENEGFGEALRFADGVIRREIAAAQARRRAGGLIRQAIKSAPDPRVVELPLHMPWKSQIVAEAPEALVVVYPRKKDWGIQAVPVDPGSFDNRHDLPQAWAGLEGPELQAASGVDDAVFCHLGRFMAVARSREGALKLAALAVAE